MAAPKGQIPPQLRPFVKGKGKATGKTSRVTAEQAKKIAAQFGTKPTTRPTLAEDKKDKGADDAMENSKGQVVKGRSVADALSVHSHLKGTL
jgi:hypothetical protein